jgi:ubiquinone biosynthesis UbiH/UbiF/VisC/COQ6 family hydroxylase
MNLEYDIAIVGAGPAALSFALSLVDTKLRLILLEKQAESQLANPPFDGREIALTPHSVSVLKKLGAWDRIPLEEISLLRNARVMNGASRHHLAFDPDAIEQEGLGYLVPNHLIRQALYAQVKSHPEIELVTERQVTGIQPNTDKITLSTSRQETLKAKLAVAADSRFSETRRMMGIAARMQDFGKTMMVCRMTHEIAHQHTAYEWFDYGQTVAILPCNGNQSSVVLTLPANQITKLMTLDEEAFNREIEARLQSRWGRMHLTSQRYAYPLVGVYPDRFVASRFALLAMPQWECTR